MCIFVHTCVPLYMVECVYSMYTEIRLIVSVGDLNVVLDLAVNTITIVSSQWLSLLWSLVW